MSKPVKISALSRNRYRASAAERRQYGGNTVTEFWVTRGDTDETLIINGYGKTPGDRKTDAIKRAVEEWGLSYEP